MKSKFQLSLFALAPFVGAVSAQATKPNVVFFLVDDFGWADVSYNGSKFYETPNIDRLAAQGMQFTNGYAAAAICSPTRCSILTGKYPARLHITDWIPGYQHKLTNDQLSKFRMIAPNFVHNLPLEEKTIAEAMKENGYKTAFVGKWHCAEDSIYFPQYQGFDKNIGGFWSGSPKGNAKEGNAYFTPYNNPYLSDGPKGEFLTDRLGDESAKYLEENKSNPFFLYLSFYSVHTPIQPKPEYAAYFREKAKKMGIDSQSEFENNHSWIRNNRHAPAHWKERTIQSNAEYAALIKSMDENVGKVLDKLVELGLDKNTIVCFTSDNGGLSTAEGSPTTNVPLRYGKGWLYEGGVREPFIIKAPGITKPGSKCNVPVISPDFYPTILDACGLKLQPTQHVDGISLLPLLKGKKCVKRKAIFWHYPHYGGKGDAPCAAVRIGDWKLIEFFEDNHVELYNLKNDISEKVDLSAQQPKIVKKLLNTLHNWQRSINVQMPTFNPEYRNRDI